MGRLEFLTPEGLRVDGRRPPEARSVALQMGVLPAGTCDGSAIVSFGNTRVLASVVGPRDSATSPLSPSTNATAAVADGEVVYLRGSFRDDVDVGQVTCRVHSAAFSSTSGDGGAKGERRLRDWADHVAMVLERVVLRDQFPRSQMDVFLEVLSADGSVLACLLNAAVLACVDAGVPMSDLVVATSGAHLLDTLFVDATRLEERAGALVTVVMRGHHQLGDADGDDAVVAVVSEPRLPHAKFWEVVREGAVRANNRRLFQEMNSLVQQRLQSIHARSLGKH